MPFDARRLTFTGRSENELGSGHSEMRLSPPCKKIKNTRSRRIKTGRLAVTPPWQGTSRSVGQGRASRCARRSGARTCQCRPLKVCRRLKEMASKLATSSSSSVAVGERAARTTFEHACSHRRHERHERRDQRHLPSRALLSLSLPA
jgi:hypothetical protein